MNRDNRWSYEKQQLRKAIYIPFILPESKGKGPLLHVKQLGTASEGSGIRAEKLMLNETMLRSALVEKGKSMMS